MAIIHIAPPTPAKQGAKAKQASGAAPSRFTKQPSLNNPIPPSTDQSPVAQAIRILLPAKWDWLVAHTDYAIHTNPAYLEQDIRDIEYVSFMFARIKTLAYSYYQTSPYVTEVPDPRYPGQTLKLDPDQIEAVRLFLEGKSFVLTGAAGSGKTLVEQAFAIAWVRKHTYTDDVGRRQLPAYAFKIPMLMRPPGMSAAEARVPAPALFIGAYTNKATAVLRQKVLCNPELAAAGFGPNLTTLHALCEFEPVQIWSDIQEKEVRRFFPQRTQADPLTGLQCIIIDEASLPGVAQDGDLDKCQIWDYLYDAMEDGTQVVLVGDINQLPPVGGKSILAYGLSQLPVHCLTYFHRQAAESPIIAAAHRILQGGYPEEAKNPETGHELQIRCWKGDDIAKYASADMAYAWYKKGVNVWLDRGMYDPSQDMFIVPYDKENNHHVERKELAHERAVKKAKMSGDAEALAKLEKRAKKPRVVKGKVKHFAPVTYFSAKTLNKLIATELSAREQKLVYTILAGFERHFLAIGDRVMINKVEGIVVNIYPNDSYKGKVRPPAPQVGIDYFGKYHPRGQAAVDALEASKRKAAYEKQVYGYSHADEGDEFDLSEIDIEAKIAEALSNDKEEEYVARAASHIVTVEMDNGEMETLSCAGDFLESRYQLGYAVTCHRAQGSEWRHVFVCMHPTNATLASREWVYTALTRAREKVVLTGNWNVYTKAIDNPRIEGDTLEAKIKFFTSGEYIKPIDLSKLA